jgi:hypothetical protein
MEEWKGPKAGGRKGEERKWRRKDRMKEEEIRLKEKGQEKISPGVEQAILVSSSWKILGPKEEGEWDDER